MVTTNKTGTETHLNYTTTETHLNYTTTDQLTLRIMFSIMYLKYHYLFCSLQSTDQFFVLRPPPMIYLFQAAADPAVDAHWPALSSPCPAFHVMMTTRRNSTSSSGNAADMSSVSSPGPQPYSDTSIFSSSSGPAPAGSVMWA